MSIRRADARDLSRIAEIYVFNNRVNYLPIFGDPAFSFGELQVVPLANDYFSAPEILAQLWVFDDGLVKGFLQMDGTEVRKLYVEPFFQSEGVGAQLLEHAVHALHADRLWALEKNTRALAFYGRHGFAPTGERMFEAGTTEYLVQLAR